MSMKYRVNNLRHNQQGLVSIIVTMIIMIVLSLIVVSFATLMRREQRQALDRQLNAQAFYAAESGVNDAVAYLKANPAAPGKFDCSGDIPGYSSNLGGNVSYSCVLINPAPKILEFTNINTDKSEVVTVIPSSAIQDLNISWESASSPDFAGCSDASAALAPEFTTSWPANCAGILRIDLVSIVPGDTFDRDEINGKAMTVFLYPIIGSSSSPVSYSSARGFLNQGKVVGVECDGTPTPRAPRQCKAVINGLTAGEEYYLRIKSIYKGSSVTITGTDGPTLKPLVGAQAVVDVTGKANDVLKRIKVHVPASRLDSTFPEYPIHSLGSICKRLFVAQPDIIELIAPPDSSCDL